MGALDSPSVKYNILVQALRHPQMKVLFVGAKGRLFTHNVKGTTAVKTADIIAQKQAITDAYVASNKPEPKKQANVA